MRFLPFLLLHVRHAAQTYLLGRVLLTFAMAWAKQPIIGAEYLALMPLLTAALLQLDRRRSGARDLYANLGYGTRTLLGIGAAVAFVAESLVGMIAAIAGARR